MEPDVIQELRTKFESARGSAGAAEVRAAAVAYYRARAKQGATQEMAANELGLTRWSLSKWHQLQDAGEGRAVDGLGQRSSPPASAEAAALRQQVEELGPRNPSRRFPSELKLRITEWTRGEVAAGRGRVAIAEQVGVPWETLSKWLGARTGSAGAGLKAVRVVGSPSRVLSTGRSGPALKTPRGFIVEGLDVPALVEVLRQLG